MNGKFSCKNSIDSLSSLCHSIGYYSKCTVQSNALHNRKLDFQSCYAL